MKKIGLLAVVFFMAMVAFGAYVAQATTINAVRTGTQYYTDDWSVINVVGVATTFACNTPVVAVAEVVSNSPELTAVEGRWSLVGPGSLVKSGTSTKTNFGSPLFFTSKFGTLPPGKYEYTIQVFEKGKKVAEKVAAFTTKGGGLRATFRSLVIGSRLFTGNPNPNLSYLGDTTVNAGQFIFGVVNLANVSGEASFDVLLQIDGNSTLNFVTTEKLDYQFNTVRSVMFSIGKGKITAGNHTAEVFVRKDASGKWVKITKTPVKFTVSS